jgi:hypothetical protein
MDMWEAGGEVGVRDERDLVRWGAETKPMLVPHAHVRVSQNRWHTSDRQP